MSTATVVTVVAPAEAERRYAELVSSVGDLEDFKTRGERYALEADDAAIYDELRDLEFLLDRE